MDSITVCAGDGSFAVSATAIACGADWAVAVCGGTHHHVGAISLGQYEPQRDSATVSTVTVFSHRDDQIAARYAKAIASARKCCVSVTAGLHVDAAGEAELIALTASSEACLCKLLERMEEYK